MIGHIWSRDPFKIADKITQEIQDHLNTNKPVPYTIDDLEGYRCAINFEIPANRKLTLTFLVKKDGWFASRYHTSIYEAQLSTPVFGKFEYQKSLIEKGKLKTFSSAEAELNVKMELGTQGDPEIRDKLKSSGVLKRLIEFMVDISIFGSVTMRYDSWFEITPEKNRSSLRLGTLLRTEGFTDRAVLQVNEFLVLADEVEKALAKNSFDDEDAVPIKSSGVFAAETLPVENSATEQILNESNTVELKKPTQGSGLKNTYILLSISLLAVIILSFMYFNSYQKNAISNTKNTQVSNNSISSKKPPPINLPQNIKNAIPAKNFAGEKILISLNTEAGIYINDEYVPVGRNRAEERENLPTNLSKHSPIFVKNDVENGFSSIDSAVSLFNNEDTEVNLIVNPSSELNLEPLILKVKFYELAKTPGFVFGKQFIIFNEGGSLEFIRYKKNGGYDFAEIIEPEAFESKIVQILKNTSDKNIHLQFEHFSKFNYGEVVRVIDAAIGAGATIYYESHYF